MPMNNVDFQNIIERVLSRTVSDEEVNINSFDQFSDYDIHEMRKLHDHSPLGCIFYVRFRMGNKVSISQAMIFIDDVVVDGMTAKDFYERNYGDHRGAIQE